MNICHGYTCFFDPDGKFFFLQSNTHYTPMLPRIVCSSNVLFLIIWNSDQKPWNIIKGFGGWEAHVFDQI